ncbi:hypothetical protein NA57DRAFT_21171, partial [Rhizodiscina lignyota]
DPRSSSTQSLVPERNAGDSRRKLVLIYIHGFMGAETSFKSFPAHVHNLTKVLLADSHVVHTKIYPRYRSRKSIDFATEDFSKWLTPHESPDTDVVLLGHSMGGLVAGEIVLLPPHSPATGQAFRHRILGVINFDVPFLGMHPGVIGSGLASLFRPAESPEQNPISSYSGSTASQLPTRQDTIFSPDNPDPNFNPKFNNDIDLPIRKGWQSAMHFLNKHGNNLVTASRQYVKSHMEFGGAMADYPSLRQRYGRIRSLEEDEEQQRRQGQGGRIAKTVREVPRVRFVNYYTASTGRPKKPKSRSRSRQNEEAERSRAVLDGQNLSLPDLSNVASRPSSRSPSNSPRISLEEHRDEGIVQKEADVPETPVSLVPDDDESESSFAMSVKTVEENDRESLQLPEIPPLPKEPEPIDLQQFRDKNVRRVMERQHARAMKAYKQAVKDRNRALKDRSKLEAKSKKMSNAPQSDANADAQSLVAPSEIGTALTTISTVDTDDRGRSLGGEDESEKRKKDKKFCMLPSKRADGSRDPAWVRVYMRGVDEVGAHCGLFVMSDTYEMLVGEVSGKIEEWVREDMSRRYI